MITIDVYGLPAPQGSKNAIAVVRNGQLTGKARMYEAVKATKPWRKVVHDAAVIAARGKPPADGALLVSMVFSFPRPAGHWGKGRNAGRLLPSAPARPAVKPDVSKLARAVEDSLTTARAWADDARVVEYSRLAKVYAGEDPGGLPVPGVRVTVCPLDAPLVHMAGKLRPFAVCGAYSALERQSAGLPEISCMACALALQAGLIPTGPAPQPYQLPLETFA